MACTVTMAGKGKGGNPPKGGFPFLSPSFPRPYGGNSGEKFPVVPRRSRFPVRDGVEIRGSA
jgi:hypothetical protein